MPEPTPTPETLRLLNEEVSARAGRLDANTARLDTKATTLLGFILAACTFLATQPVGGWWKVEGGSICRVRGRCDARVSVHATPEVQGCSTTRRCAPAPGVAAGDRRSDPDY
jgi:hypothetical protein